MDKTKPVLITGATGYVAGWVVKRFLEEGFIVHAPIRSPENPEKTKYLDALVKELPGTIRYFKADLLTQGSYTEAMQGCELVIHTASPFVNSVKDSQRDLVDPALKGTTNVLDSVNQVESVKRVVLTSSCAAIWGDNIDLLQVPNGTLKEDQWNETSTVNHQPYYYSKTVAEKKAWEISEAQNKWSLVTINPSLVLGPGINPNATSESFNIVKQLGDGTMKMGVPDFQMGAVDVRDVAEAHYQAAIKGNAKGRHILSGENLSFLQLATFLKDHFGDKYPFPKKTLPKFLVVLMGPLSGFKRKMLRNNVGYPWKADNTKSKIELGIQYASIKNSIVEMFDQLLAAGIISKK